MNFNTQLAFIPRAVIVEAKRERTERVGSAWLSSRKAKPQVKDRWIDRSWYPRVYGPVSSPPSHPSFVFRSWALLRQRGAESGRPFPRSPGKCQMTDPSAERIAEKLFTAAGLDENQ